MVWSGWTTGDGNPIGAARVPQDVIEVATRIQGGHLSIEDGVKHFGVSDLSPFWRLRPLYLRLGVDCDIWALCLIDGMHCWTQLVPRIIRLLSEELPRGDFLEVLFCFCFLYFDVPRCIYSSAFCSRLCSLNRFAKKSIVASAL